MKIVRQKLPCFIGNRLVEPKIRLFFPLLRPNWLRTCHVETHIESLKQQFVIEPRVSAAVARQFIGILDWAEAEIRILSAQNVQNYQIFGADLLVVGQFPECFAKREVLLFCCK